MLRLNDRQIKQEEAASEAYYDLKIALQGMNKSTHSFMVLPITPEEDATLRCISIPEQCGSLLLLINNEKYPVLELCTL